MTLFRFWRLRIVYSFYRSGSNREIRGSTSLARNPS
uniref:Uncharacterized protein n=1 Tax=Manihot esculenta TaxID=3983 RepID=A0A2C9UCA4_MANES